MPTASFDVFDTLLTRIWAEPRDLFVALGREFQSRGWAEATPEEFAGIRREAEQAARGRAPAGETNLGQIYDELAARMGWDPARRTLAMQEEINLEKAGIRPVPGRQEAVREARRRCGRVIFLSDMYLPPAVIREWLVDAGFHEPGDELLVSGEAGVGKGTGGLFRLVHERLRADYADWMHWGDHPVADAAAPRALGITIRLNRDTQLTRHERTLRGSGKSVPPWRSLVAGAARLARLEAPAGLTARQQELWQVGATVAGPLFWGFTRWCLEEARRRNLGDLYFLARGGQIFWRIAGLLPDAGPVRRHYLYSSRLAFAGAFDAGDTARLRVLAASSLVHHSVRQALANLGLGEGDLELPPRWPRAGWDDDLPPSERMALADWLLAPERLPLVRQALLARAALTREYLLNAGLGAGTRAGVVDTGWMGTIQKNMEFLLGDVAGPVPLQGFYLGLSPVREFRCHGESLAYTNTFRRLSLRRETTHLILLEIMTRGTHGPLLGFAREGGRLEPRLGPLPEAQREEVELFQSAVLAFVRQVGKTGAALSPPATIARVLIDNYLDFFRHPSLAEARTIGAIPHADQMLEQRHRTLCQEMTLGELLQAFVSFARRPPGWWLAGQARLGHAAWLKAYQLAKQVKWALQTRLTGQPD